MKTKSIDTLAVHAGEKTGRAEGAVVGPIYQTAMFLFSGEDDPAALRYQRYSNTPSHLALQEKLAALEGGEAALVSASGMASMSSALVTLAAGGHVLAQNGLYGGTHGLLEHDLPKLGISHTFVEMSVPAAWGKSLRPETKVFVVEAVTNPLVRVGDLERAAEFARKHNLVSIIDATFASPVNFNPLSIGFDLVMHSCTKYLNGHSDLVAGCLVGKKETIGKIAETQKHLGGSLDAHACFLLQRGIKTLAIRVKQQNVSALALAKFLSTHPKIEKVNYPGLETDPSYAHARRLFRGFGGMLSFEARGTEKDADRLMSKLTIPLVAPSLGGVESLVTRPAKTSHRGLAPEERKRWGIADRLIRVSVGIEDTQELIEDFRQALEQL